MAHRFGSRVHDVADDGAPEINCPLPENDFELVECFGKSRRDARVVQFKHRRVVVTRESAPRNSTPSCV